MPHKFLKLFLNAIMLKQIMSGLAFSIAGHTSTVDK